MKSTSNLTSFNAGELSPLMVGRSDIRYYATSARKMRNFVPTLQGPVRRRPGTRFVQETKVSANRSWLHSWITNGRTAYVMEFGNRYVRFFANHGSVSVPGFPGLPLELVTPWLIGDLTNSDGGFALRIYQVGDVMYVVHPNYAPQVITRTGSAAFNIAPYSFIDGPFDDIDPDAPITIEADARTGNANLVASSPFFIKTAGATIGMEGELFLMEQKYADGNKFWEPGKVVAIGDIRRSDSKNYKALTAGTTGSIKPTHSTYWLSPTHTAKFDGDPGVQWEFQDPGYGWGIILSVTDTTHAQIGILSPLPADIIGVGKGTTRYAFGQYSIRRGWPDNVCVHRERLTFFKKRAWAASVAGDFTSFLQKDNGLVTADSAITATAYTDSADTVQWLMQSNQALLVGSGTDESAIVEANINEPFGPGNTALHRQSTYGSRGVPALAAGDGILFVSRSGRILRDLKLAESVDTKWVASNLTVLADHVSKSGIIDMDYAQDPLSVVWAITAEGRLLGFTLDRDQEVHGWHPHRIGGWIDAAKTSYAVVESVAVIPVGDRDEVWLQVRRNINGVTKRYIEYIEYDHERDDNPYDAFYVDCGLSLNGLVNLSLGFGINYGVKGATNVIAAASGPIFAAGDVGRYIHYPYFTYDIAGNKNWHTAIMKITAFTDNQHVLGTILVPFPNGIVDPLTWRMTVTSVTGLAHLEGQTVSVMADGAVQPDTVVVGGAIALSTPASRVHVGLAAPAVLQPMPIGEGQGSEGSSRGSIKRVQRVTIKFFETGGGKYGRDEDKQMDRVQNRGSDPMSQALSLFTGDVTVSFPDGSDTEALITIVQDQPFPMTILSIAPHYTENPK